MKIHFKSLSSVALIIILVIMPWSIDSEDRRTPISGTLILATTCEEGVIMTVDTRAMQGFKKSKYFDHAQKLREIGSKGMFAISGVAFIGDKNENDPSPIMLQRRLFDATQIVESFFRGNDITDIDENVHQMKENLINESYKFFSSHKNIVTKLKEGDFFNNTDKTLYRILLFAINNHKAFSGYDLQGILIQNTEGISFNVKVERISEDFFSKVQLRCHGQAEVIDKIFLEHDPRFNDVQKDPDIISFALKMAMGKTPEDFSGEEAKALLKKLIKITSERGSMLGLEPSVGPQCDCAILLPAKGFKWLEKNSTVK
jgi:hypothetical protein